MFREGDEAISEEDFVRLSYSQAALDFLSGSYPVPFEEAARLAALQAGAEGCVGGVVGGGRGRRKLGERNLGLCRRAGLFFSFFSFSLFG